MTFCIGIKVNEGLVGVADTRISSGTEVTMARKLTLIEGDRYSMFIMTSGLRSLRDKTLAYFEDMFRASASRYSIGTQRERRTAGQPFPHHLKLLYGSGKPRSLISAPIPASRPRKARYATDGSTEF